MTFLLVDDSSTVRMMYQNIISRVFENQCTIIEASNGEEGLQAVQEHDNIDLILLDVNMPVMKGDIFLIKLRENPKYDSIKVIMSTTEAHKDTVRELIKKGANGYIVKPFNLNKFQNAINIAFRGARCNFSSR